MNKTTETKTYRIPAAPIGRGYYRQGTLYEPGEIVVIPANEVPAGWGKIGGSLRPVAPHAWKEVAPGTSRAHVEADEEHGLALARAREQRAELASQLAEQERLVAELETDAGEQESGADGASDPDAGEDPTQGAADGEGADEQPHGGTRVRVTRESDDPAVVAVNVDTRRRSRSRPDADPEL